MLALKQSIVLIWLDGRYSKYCTIVMVINTNNGQAWGAVCIYNPPPPQNHQCCCSSIFATLAIIDKLFLHLI